MTIQIKEYRIKALITEFSSESGTSSLLNFIHLRIGEESIKVLVPLRITKILNTIQENTIYTFHTREYSTMKETRYKLVGIL